MTLLSGSADTGAVIGFGVSTSSVLVTGNTINLGGATTAAVNAAFSLPSNAIVNALSGFFHNVVALALPTETLTVHIQLYHETPAVGPDLFNAVPGASVDLVIGGTVLTGATFRGTVSGLNFPVNVGDRLLLAATVTAAGVTLVTTATGYISAGLQLTLV